MVKTLWHFAETHSYPVTQVLPSRGSQQEENRQVFPALNSILVGKRDHTQANEEARVPVWPSLALWPPGDLGSRAQGMMRARGWWWALLFFPGSGAALSREEKEACFLILAPVASHFMVVLSRFSKHWVLQLVFEDVLSSHPFCIWIKI